jgi:putative acetyltransferase
VIVRPATEADIAAMARVAERSYRAAFDEILEHEVLATRDAAFFGARFGEAWERMRVAEDGGRVLGFTLVTDGHIDMIFAQAEAEGARSLESFRDNHAARRFYERRGWRLTREYERAFLGAERAFAFYEKP